MLDWISGDLIKILSSPGAPFGVLVLFFIMNQLGWIRPRIALTEVRQDRDARLAEKDQVIKMITDDRDTWRAALERSEAARELQAESNREQLELTRTAVAALDGFRMAARWLEQEKGPRDVVEPPG